MDGEFLMTQIELREELADIKHHAQPLEMLNHFLNRLTQQMQVLTTTLSQQFAQQAYPTACDCVRQYQFFQRLYEEALALEETLS
jgi:molecular chaperone HscB